MKYLRITNQGIIEHQALSLLGASSKRNDDTKIGQFGSGNKYALAYFLRNGSIQVYSGTTLVPITTQEEIFREQKFNVVYINGERTSITTDFGMEWKFWQAVREIYSNALDEGEARISLVDAITPKENETHFYIQTTDRDIQEFVDAFDKYFSEKRKVLYENQFGQILAKDKFNELCLYRKGIRCMDSPKKSLFDYNLNSVPIGENRLVNYWWNAHEMIWKILLSCEDETIIKNLLLHCVDGEYIEGSPDNVVTLSKEVSVTFIRVLNSFKVAPRSFSQLMAVEEINKYVFLPDKLYDHLVEFIDDKNKPKGMQISKDGKLFKPFTMEPLHKVTLEKAMDFFKETDFSIPFPVEGAIFENKNVLGIAHIENNTIYLSNICLEKGVSEIVSTILEEYIHLKYFVQDETRSFQNASIQELVNYMKRKNAYVL